MANGPKKQQTQNSELKNAISKMNKIVEKEDNWNGIYAITIGVSGLIIAEFLPAGVLTPMALDLNISEGTAGQAITATSVFAVITSLLIAYVTRKYDRKHVLLGLSIFLSISSLVVAYSPNFSTLIFGRMLLGIALGGFWSMAAAIASRLVSEKSVPKALSIIFGGSSFSAVLAAPLGSYLGGIIGWRNVFILATFVGIAAFIWQLMAIPSLRPLGEIKLRTTIDVLKKPQFLSAMIALMFMFCGRFASFTYLRPFLETTTHLAHNAVTIALLIFGLSYFVGNWFAPRLIQRNIHSALFVPPLLLTAVGIGLAVWGSSPGLTFFFVFLWGSFFGPVAPSWSTWMAKKVPEYAETAGGLYVASIQLAAAIGALGGGIVYDVSGSQGVFGLSAASWLLSAAVVHLGITGIKNKIEITN